MGIRSGDPMGVPLCLASVHWVPLWTSVWASGGWSFIWARAIGGGRALIWGGGYPILTIEDKVGVRDPPTSPIHVVGWATVAGPAGSPQHPVGGAVHRQLGRAGAMESSILKVQPSASPKKKDFSGCGGAWRAFSF